MLLIADILPDSKTLRTLPLVIASAFAVSWTSNVDAYSNPELTEIGLSSFYKCRLDRAGPMLVGWCNAGTFYGPLQIGWTGVTRLERGFFGIGQVSVGNLVPSRGVFRGLVQLGLYNEVEGPFWGMLQTGAINIALNFTGLAQIGLANLFSRFNGLLQLAVLNAPTRLKGMQVGLLNITEGYGIVVGLVNVFDASSDCGSDQRTSTIYGLQLAGAVNYSGAWYGIQVGPVNVTISPEKPSDRYPRRNPSWGHGLQLGMVNVGAIKGLQVGLWNDGMQGAMVQVGIVNRARRVTGLQLGVVNISDELRGMQLGLVNVARTASIPVTVLVNADF